MAISCRPGVRHRATFAAGAAVLGCAIAAAAAQTYPTQYVAATWQTEQGLPQNSINAMLQDRQGYLWAGTFAGLVRFDGVRFTVFDSASVPPFNDVRILSLYEDRSGALWVGSYRGVTRMERGAATTYDQDTGLPSSFIRSIRADAGGRVWVNTARGVAHFGGARPEPYPSHGGRPVSEFYLQARDGSMWFQSGTDILRSAPDGTAATLAVGNQNAMMLQEAHDGSVWIAFPDQPRLVRYAGGRFADVTLPPLAPKRFLAPAESQTIMTLTTDNRGELLLLTTAGVVRILDGEALPPESLPIPKVGHALPKLRGLLVDREGNLWVGTIGGGLVRCRPAPLTAYGEPEGLSDASFNTVFQDREGRVWMAGDSVYWFDGQRFHQVPGIRDVFGMTQTRDGDLWFGGYEGLHRWRAGVLHRYAVDAPLVISVYEDREGTLWIGGPSAERPGGLFRFRGDRLERVTSLGGVRRIGEDRDGVLWVASVEGLFSLRDGKATLYKGSENLPARVTDMTQDSTGTFWLASSGGGLIRWQPSGFKSITSKDGLPNNRFGGALQDGRGNLWFSSDRGIFFVSVKELNDFVDGRTSSVVPAIYGVGEGMRTNECNGGSPAAWRSRDGRLWFPTLRGVVAVDPDARNPLPPPVVLEESRAGTVTLSPDGGTSAPPGSGTLDFRYTALSLSAPERIRFKYRLEPYQTSWVEAGADRTAHYTNMAPGEYSFRVIAANNYGVWNEQGAAVRFVLRPHFYQTAIFRALCGACFLAVLWAGYQLRVRRMRQQFQLASEARIEERMRIARELHDTLLQNFHGLVLRLQGTYNLLPGRAPEAQTILASAIDDAARVITEARDTVEALRSRPVICPDLAEALEKLGQELAATQDSQEAASFSLDVEGEAPALDPDCRDEIYRIACEALRNAFAHARASRVEAEIRYDARHVRVRVRDDGIGIEPGVLTRAGAARHWGLKGMRERAKRIGGQLEVWSDRGAGTEVEVTVPASKAYVSDRDRKRKEAAR